MAGSVLRYLESVQERRRSVRGGRDAESHQIILLPQGLSLPWLSVQVGEGAADIRWHQIKEVRALKTVARQYDLICLRIETYDGRQVDLDEDLDGWEALIDALPRRLTGCRTWQDWWPEVAWPPLRETETVVFTR